MTLNEYLQTHRATELAKEIGCTSTEISHWRNGVREVPIRRCLPIETATHGEVTRKDLRPDDWAEFWPELADAA